MKRKRSISLLWKMLIWLLLHLAVLALILASFAVWQLHSGWEMLLRGPAGDRLRISGEQMSSQLSQQPESQWQSLMTVFAEQHGVTCDVWMPHGEWATHTLPQVPAEVMDKFKRERRQGPRGQGPRNGMRGGPRGEPDSQGFSDPPIDEPREMRDLLDSRIDAPPMRTVFQPVRPIFFMRDTKGEAYWVAIHLPLLGRTAPDHVVWLIRSESLTGDGLFLNVTPWVIGAVALLMMSLLFWIPFALHITRYVAKLKSATDDIAEGRFHVDIDVARRDELGDLGAAIHSMALRLDRSIKGQKRFLGDVAHELCSPLARLRTGLGILESRLPATEQARLSGIEDEARELAELIDEILAFSRASAAMEEVKGTPQILRDVVEETILREAPHANVERSIDAAMVVRADAKLLKRAIGNVLRNAVRYAGADARIHLSTSIEGSFVALSIDDDGPGVSEDEVGRLFEPFYRPDVARARETGGVGLGLTIVKSCVEACGGSVTASNMKPQGFRVKILLPQYTPDY